MVEGMRMKQLETRINAMEFGMSQTQGAMVQTREDVVIMKEALRGDTEKNREMLEQYRQRLNNMLGMLLSLP